MTIDSGSTNRAFVLGFDGVPWYLIERWTDEGELPNFARIREEGVAGPLESTLPPTTALAWPSIATGVRPDKHGIYGFQRLSSEHTQRMNTSVDVKRAPLWEQLTPAVVGNVPVTYPASEIDGTLVTGMLTPERGDGFTHPPELAAEIERRIPDYRINLDWSSYEAGSEEFLEDLTALVEARRELMRLLMAEEAWRLFFFVYTAPDRLQHLAWNEETMLEHYRFLDDIVGEVEAYATANDATLFIVSDHGFGPISKYVSVNGLLEDEGLLTRRHESGARGLLTRVGITKDAVLDALRTVGIDEEIIVRHLPRSVVDAAAGAVPGEHFLYDVDYSRTVAFCHGAGNVYVNDTRRFSNGIVEPSAVPDVKGKLETILSAVTDPETGRRVLSVSDGTALFPTDDDAPDLVVTGSAGYEVTAALTESAIYEPETAVASHRREGIFLAAGPDVRAGGTPTDASVVDVAPTVLHSVGAPVPEDVDGCVLDELFEPGSVPARSDVRRRASVNREVREAVKEDFSDVESRLKGLGYME